MTPGGILLLDKPTGLSSNAALQRVRRRYGGAKAGHTGSLDPLASGMLPICIGEATKLAGLLLSERKCYRFDLTLGERRATGDAEGEVVETGSVPALTESQVREVLHRRLGPQQQVPPMYSALKQGGQPLYKLARQGVTVERAARHIEIEALQLLVLRPPVLELRVNCSKGTYVRVLAEDLARDLGSCGFVSLLRREYVEPFADRAMVTLAELESAAALPALIPADQAIPQLPAARLDAAASMALRHGQPVASPWPGTGPVRLYDATGAFFGLGEVDAAGRLRPRRLFVTACSA